VTLRTRTSGRRSGGWSLGAALRRLLRRKGPGDLLLQLEIITVAPRDDRSRAPIEEFGRLNPQRPREELGWG
jgi:hypothetical protein